MRSASLCLMFAFALPSAFAGNVETMAFARANAGKFKSEIVEKAGISLDSRASAQGVLDWIDMLSFRPKYDDENGEMVIASHAHFSSLKLHETCKATGSFVGQNAFGAKTNVKRETCERFFVQDGSIFTVQVGGMRVKMSPAQFRDIQKNGALTEVDFTVGHPKQTEVVTFSKSLNEATISNPVETRMSVWTVFGQIEEVRWILSKDRTVVSLWRRQQ